MTRHEQFKKEGSYDFFNTNPKDGFGSPVFIVALVAKQALSDGLELELPGSYSVDTLQEICENEPSVGEGIVITNGKGKDIASIARQILSLDSEGHIQPPLKYLQKVIIKQLVEIVDNTETLPRGD